MPPQNLRFVFLMAILSVTCYSKATHNRYAAQLADAMQLITYNYVEDVKQRELFEQAMRGMVTGLDPYSTYIPPDAYRAMEQSLDQEFGGVGIEVEKLTDEDPIVVLRPVYDGPAYRAGLRAGDKIIAINGESTIGMKQENAVTLMRGAPGTPVKLRIERAAGEEPYEIEVQREIITVESLLGETRNADGTWDFRLSDHPRIGYLRVTTFGKHTAEEIGEALGAGQGCPFEAVILDLRNNAGGLLDSAVETCDLFIEGGRIVSTRGRDGIDRSVVEATETIVIPESIPIVVLINRYSASASEIVAACLQDHGRAKVAGERSFGKGTVQVLFRLEGGASALKLTTATYWRPSGKNIHRLTDAGEQEDWGVHPDTGLGLKLTDEQMEQVFRARRDRDVGRSPGTMAPQPKPAAASEQPDLDPALPDGKTPLPSEPAAADPQLKLAVEYLENL